MAWPPLTAVLRDPGPEPRAQLTVLRCAAPTLPLGSMDHLSGTPVGPQTGATPWLPPPSLRHLLSPSPSELSWLCPATVAGSSIPGTEVNPHTSKGDWAWEPPVEHAESVREMLFLEWGR